MRLAASPQAPRWFQDFVIGLNRYLATTQTSSAGAYEHLALPEDQDETGTVYYYYGWSSVDSGWLIQRQTIATGLSDSATSGAANYAAAWTGRASLTYV